MNKNRLAILFLLLLFCSVTYYFLTAQEVISEQDQNWDLHIIDSSHSGADGVRLADVNSDGLMDITTGWEEGGLTKVYLNPGSSLSKDKWPLVIVGKTPDVEDAMFLDINNDGNYDVISSTEGNTKKIFVNCAPSDPDDYLDATKWKTELLPASDIQQQWMFAIPADIDGKNGLDFFAGAKNKNAQVGWFQAPENPSNLSDWKWHPISDATWVMSMITTDMDNDGDLDLVLSDRKKGATNGVRWLENPSDTNALTQEWKNHLIGCQGKEVMFMDMADLNQDGLEDAIVTEYTNQQIVYLQKLDNTGLNWKSHTINISENTGRAKAVKIGDINQDGKLDIVHTSNTLGDTTKSGVFWLSYKNTPFESEWDWHNISGTKGIKYDRIELIDLDGDGDLDVLTCEENYGENNEGLGVIWYENPTKK